MIQGKPKVRTENSSLYPSNSHQIHPNANEDDFPSKYLVFQESQDQIKLFEEWCNSIRNDNSTEHRDSIIQLYTNLFHGSKGARYFDLHGQHFQNFALEVTRGMNHTNLRKLSTSKDHANRRILRARVYAVCTRSDVDWDGTPLQEVELINKKKNQLLDHLQSLYMYDWYTLSSPPTSPQSTSVSEPFNLEISCIRQGTQEAVEQLHNESNKKIAWLNFAAGHNVCGSYSVNHGGSQEEEVATNCDGAVLLGTMGEMQTTGIKSVARGNWVLYKNGCHIPPGGNYFAKTTFVTCEKPIECYMIATAFADFRLHVPIFHPYSERSFFFTLSGATRDEAQLHERCMIDIEGVLKTCIQNGIECLVTGASGCGAFYHDPFVECKLWRRALTKPEYRTGSLKKVVFAVLDKEDSKNWIAFNQEFNN
ncbi:nucleoporin Nup214 [Acrasis kona]|uniref:Nucleoporin Nup214 n=1 Tax=Acrasis kona TaxID=1008807 RepID=A0AAW2YRD2_9EUKA